MKKKAILAIGITALFIMTTLVGATTTTTTTPYTTETTETDDECSICPSSLCDDIENEMNEYRENGVHSIYDFARVCALRIVWWAYGCELP